MMESLKETACTHTRVRWPVTLRPEKEEGEGEGEREFIKTTLMVAEKEVPETHTNVCD
jgi:hypothetical protein